MAKKRPIVECGFCGELKPATDDHIPPRAIYVDPRPSTLPTVKACERCNGGASQDDEYFRDALALYEKVGDQSHAAPLVDAMLRAAANPNKAGYTRRILSSFTTVELRSQSGLYLGTRDAFRADDARLTRAGERYVRGLHRYELGRRPRDDFEVKVQAQPDNLRKHSESILDSMKSATFRVVQPNVFLYGWISPSDAPDVSVWLLLFYQAFPVLGFVMPKDRRAPG